MGKGSNSQLVGYSYTASVSYAIATEVDAFVSYFFNEEVKLVNYLPSNFLSLYNNYHISPSATAVIQAQLSAGERKPYAPFVSDGINEAGVTGKSGDVQGSGYSKSYCQFNRWGSDIIPLITGEPTNYNGVSTFEFRNGFIGDNVSSLPAYNFLVRRMPKVHQGNFLMSHHGIIDNWNNQVIFCANPVMVILEILVKLLRIPQSKIDFNSFETSAIKVASEYIGINMVIDETKKASELIENITELVHGNLILDPITKKFSFRLMRLEYDPAPITGLNVINIDTASNIEVEASGVENLYNTLSIEHTICENYNQPKTEKYNVESKSLLAQHGIAKIKEIDLTMLWTTTALKAVADRLITKYSSALIVIKFKVSTLLNSHNVGDLLWFQPNIQAEYYVPIRITKIAGDSVYDEYITIDAVQDTLHKVISTTSFNFETVPHEVPIQVFDDVPNPTRLLMPSRENTNYKGFFILSSYKNDKPIGTTIKASNGTNSTLYNQALYTVGTITNINKSSDWSKLVDRNSYIDVTITQGFMPVFDGTEADVQRLTNIIIIGDEVISFRVCVSTGANTFRLSHFIRGVNDRTSDHNIGDLLWYYPDKGSSASPTPIVTPTGSFTIKAVASGEESAEVTLPYSYNGELETPYDVQGLKFDGNSLKWSPRVRLKGARYSNLDLLVAGSEEGMYEGVFKVYKEGVLVDTTSSTSYSINSNGFYQVSCFLSPYESNKEGVVVNVF